MISNKEVIAVSQLFFLNASCFVSFNVSALFEWKQHMGFKGNWAVHAIFNALITVADPGFPWGGHQPQKGHQPIIRSNFSVDCMKIKRIGPRGRVRIRNLYMQISHLNRLDVPIVAKEFTDNSFQSHVKRLYVFKTTWHPDGVPLCVMLEGQVIGDSWDISILVSRRMIANPLECSFKGHCIGNWFSNQ